MRLKTIRFGTTCWHITVCFNLFFILPRVQNMFSKVGIVSDVIFVTIWTTGSRQLNPLHSWQNLNISAGFLKGLTLIFTNKVNSPYFSFSRKPNKIGTTTGTTKPGCHPHLDCYLHPVDFQHYKYSKQYFICIFIKNVIKIQSSVVQYSQ